MILSAPPARNVPAASLGAVLEPKGSNGAKTTPFKNVLDAFEMPDGSVSDSGKQKSGAQTPSPKKETSVLAPDPSASTQQQPATQPQIPLPRVAVMVASPISYLAQQKAVDPVVETEPPQGQTEASPEENPAQSAALNRVPQQAAPISNTPIAPKVVSYFLPAQLHATPVIDTVPPAKEALPVKSVAPPPAIPASAMEPTEPVTKAPTIVEASPAAPLPTKSKAEPASVGEQSSICDAPAVQPRQMPSDSRTAAARDTAAPQAAKSFLTASVSMPKEKTTIEPTESNKVAGLSGAVAAQPGPSTLKPITPGATPQSATTDNWTPQTVGQQTPEPIAAPEPAPLPVAASTPAGAPKESGPVTAPNVPENAGPPSVAKDASFAPPVALRATPRVSPKQPSRQTETTKTHLVAKALPTEKTPTHAPTPQAMQPTPPAVEIAPQPTMTQTAATSSTATPQPLPAPMSATAPPQASRISAAPQADPIPPAHTALPKAEDKVSRQTPASQPAVSHQAPTVPAATATAVPARDSQLAASPVQSTPPVVAAEAAKPDVPSSKSAAPDRPVARRSEPIQAPIPTTVESKPPAFAAAANLAFEVHMLAPETAVSNSPITQNKSAALPASAASEAKPPLSSAKPAPIPEEQQPQRADSQTNATTRQQAESADPTPQKTDASGIRIAASDRPATIAGGMTRWNEISVPQAVNLNSPPSSEAAAASQAGPAPSVQAAHLLTPELPKTAAPSEILLQVAGNDQTAAAIRVADRGGMVNVSVHASDPVLRESLRSNLGELSAQLSQQGWKTETAKPTAIAAQSENQQDSHAGNRQPSQQHSFGGDRQAPRERRNTGRNWQQELDQHISSGPALSGGNG